MMLWTPYYPPVPSNPPSSSHPSTVERILAGLAKLSLVMRHEAWRASGKRGLTPTQSQILCAIAGSRAPVGVTWVANQLKVTMGTASEAVKALAEKGLVEKTTDAQDGRAVALRLTRAGRREAARAGQWPDSMRKAVVSLPEDDRAALLRGLIGMVRFLQEQGAVSTARMCVQCRYFRPNAHRGAARPHHCQFIDAPIADADLRLDCDEMEPAPVELRSRLWREFVSRGAQSTDQEGHRPSPSESGRRVRLSTGGSSP